jgi:hypothetical protein
LGLAVRLESFSKRWKAFYSDFPCLFKVSRLRRLASWGSHNDTTTHVLTMMYDVSGDSTDLLLFFPGLACFHELKVDAWIHQSIYLAPDRLIFFYSRRARSVIRWSPQNAWAPPRVLALPRRWPMIWNSSLKIIDKCENQSKASRHQFLPVTWDRPYQWGNSSAKQPVNGEKASHQKSQEKSVVSRSGSQ